MLSFDTVHALTACLLYTQHHTPTGAELLGTLVLAQDHPLDPADPRLRHLRTLHLPLSGHGQHHSLPAALHQIADALTARDPWCAGRTPAGTGPLHPDDLAILGHALREPRPGLRLVAWAVCYDDLHADPEQLDRVRRVEAVDVDGRVYQLSLYPGDTYPVVLIDEQPEAADLPAPTRRWPGWPASRGRHAPEPAPRRHGPWATRAAVRLPRETPTPHQLPLSGRASPGTAPLRRSTSR